MGGRQRDPIGVSSATGRGLVASLLSILGARVVSFAMSRTVVWTDEVGCTLVLLVPLLVVLVMGRRSAQRTSLLLGLSFSAPWALVAMDPAIDPVLSGGGGPELAAATLGVVVATTQPAWSLRFARALSRLTGWIGACAPLAATVATAGVAALAASAVATPRQAGATEWRRMATFLARPDAMATERDWARAHEVRVVSFGRTPIGRSAHVLRLPDTADPSFRWTIPEGEEIDVDVTSVGWARPACAASGDPPMRCPLASQLPFVVLETDTDALVVHPGPRVASDATYCALNRGPASTSRLSQIGIRRLGAPREVGVLLPHVAQKPDLAFSKSEI